MNAARLAIRPDAGSANGNAKVRCEAWLGLRTGPKGKLERGWNPVPPAVVRSALMAARSAADAPLEPGMEEDLRFVFRWAAQASPRLDKLQRRAGWPWLLRRATLAERRRLLMQVEGPRGWFSALDEVASGGLRATVMATVEELVDEGIAFHNCIADYVLECQLGESRIFAVRDVECGRRVAVVRLDYDEGEKAWVLHDVLGIANEPVGDEVRAFAERLAQAYHYGSGGSKHDSELPVEECDRTEHWLEETAVGPGPGSCVEPAG